MTALVRYDAACRALAEAKSIDEVKDIRDKAEAMRAYARQAKNKDLEANAIEIRMRAGRRLNALMGDQARTVGLNKGRAGAGRPKKGGVTKTPRKDERPTLAEAGIDKNLAKEARRMGALSDAKFEDAIVAARESVTRAAKTAMRAVEIKVELEGRPRSPNDTCAIADLGALAGRHKFGAILADPPWSFRVYSGKGKARSAERHYDTLTLDDIKALPVANLAAEDCALFLWSVMPQLPEALAVIDAWGFEYKTCGFCWAKQNESGRGFATGMGYWTRANAELCLLATRGSPKRLHKDVQQLIVSPVMEHSRKPDVAHERIERLVAGPYLELFGRRITPGWTVWGNEIERRLFDGEIREVA